MTDNPSPGALGQLRALARLITGILMTDTSSEPTLAFENMKHPFEKTVWDTLLGEWSCSLWTVLLRTIWIGVAVAACIGALRLMAWADEGSRNTNPTNTQP